MADNLEYQQAARREARKQAQDEARKVMQEQREERAQATAEAVKRMESTQPTPTQEENDLAKLGVLVDDKEDDGSGETIIEKRIVANQPLARGGYETRSVRAKSDEQTKAERERQPPPPRMPRPGHEG